MPPSAIIQAIPYIGSGLMALKSLFGGGGTGAGETAKQYQELLRRVPELQQMLGLGVQSAQQQQPLQEALIRLSMNLLPKSARAGYGWYDTPPTTRPDYGRSEVVQERKQRM